MRIILTGASSFTGYWFARTLGEAGHEVVAPLSGSHGPGTYTGVRGRRVEHLKQLCRTIFAAPFGSDAFLQTVRSIGPFDVLCHHWAETRGYRDPDFDAVGALAANADRLPEILRLLPDCGCGRVVLTGSVFAQGEGIGNPPLRAFSPYGLSKGLTTALFAYYCDRAGVALDRFVIPNPFGPFEEPRFTNYLMRTWCGGGVAAVATPNYVRDNIHVDLLARAYAAFVADDAPGGRVLGPSLYVETQGAFAERVAREVRGRLPFACDLDLAEQTSFAEPQIRINTDVGLAAALGWREAAAWDAFVAYYAKLYDRR
ncbi:MAG TPA: NAD(P)-dependent oxidoreductase [Stellaceae bacterium]|nr:NAD(P)-dependent oxidoreductase [Stellaceae bacterium]